MHKVITTFYQAFTELDAETMVRCYHKNIRFEDPAFGELHGERAKNMWRMLCASQQGKDFQVSFDKIVMLRKALLHGKPFILSAKQVEKCIIKSRLHLNSKMGLSFHMWIPLIYTFGASKHLV